MADVVRHTHPVLVNSRSPLIQYQEPLPERKQRKSVAFSEGTTLIDHNGDISMSNGEGHGNSADSHSGEPVVDEVTESFDDLALKKKKKSSKKKTTEDEEAAEAPAEDAEFDPTALKKKKKKKVVKDEDFEAKLAEAGATGDKEPEADAAEATPADAGDMDEGTGVWAHDGTAPISYNLLLNRFFKLLNAHNPDLMSAGTKSHKIPPPQCLREGNKKTIFANIPEICKRMKRSEEHVTQFLFAELGTTGSTDGSRRLVIKGKFMQKQIENVLRRYIVSQSRYDPNQSSVLTCFRENTLHARRAGHLIQNSSEERTVSISSTATRAAAGVVSLRSRLVSRRKSASVAGSRARRARRKYDCMDASKELGRMRRCALTKQ